MPHRDLHSCNHRAERDGPLATPGPLKAHIADLCSFDGLVPCLGKTVNLSPSSPAIFSPLLNMQRRETCTTNPPPPGMFCCQYLPGTLGAVHTKKPTQRAGEHLFNSTEKRTHSPPRMPCLGFERCCSSIPRRSLNTRAAQLGISRLMEPPLSNLKGTEAPVKPAPLGGEGGSHVSLVGTRG